MGAPYTSVSVASYNANPPPDDGSQVPANRVTWAKSKEKLADPLKVALESMNTNIGTAFGKVIGGAGITSTALTYGVGAADQGKLVVATASGITITTPDAATVGNPFVFGVLNNSSGDITLDGSGSQTVNGSANLTMKAGDGWLVFTDGTNWFVIGRKTGVLPRGHIDGCGLANGTDATNDINVAEGVCRDSTNAVDIPVATMAGKQLDANWAPGANAGMRNSAAGIANTTYHIYAVMKADLTQDIYAHTSTTVATVLTALQAESGGASYVYARRIGSIIRVGGTILAFVQTGNFFQLVTPANDVATSTLGGAGTSYTLTTPAGIKTDALISAAVTNAAAGANVIISSLDEADNSPDPLTGRAHFTVQISNRPVCGQFKFVTNTSSQIRARSDTASTTLNIATRGWTDWRGQNA